MPITRYIPVVQRRGVTVEDTDAATLEMLEPLFAIETHMYFEERIGLFKLANILPPGFVACEIGSYLGGSTAFLAAAASRRNGHIHAVDTWLNDAMPDAPGEDTFGRFLENTQAFAKRITAHRGLAAAVCHEVPAIDLLFLDGDHSYDGTREDLALYGPKLKPGGILVMHDYTYDSVKRALADTYPKESLVQIAVAHSLHAFRVLNPFGARQIGVAR
ncbi:MAG TPA: class I SAM-dependent methyltransferase [Pirellulales bacterium]|jgi:predicted O-methyltransferase YrrM|nr:class I SAM-dependent methyltransferase [Pirellulales bacterium]